MSLYRKVFRAEHLPVLARLMRDADLKFVDVGGRGEAFAPLLPLASFADYYVAEPDVTEAGRLAERLAQETPWRSVTVIPKAIASETGVRNLYLTAQPGMSSLLEPNSRIVQQYHHLAKRFRVIEVVQVPTMPLDAAAEQYGFADATFLKIDTQGTELEILQSGAALLRSVVGIHTESLFQPLYKGQALFADVDRLTRQAGFELVALNRTLLRRAGYRKSLYSKRLITWAHCLYLRDATSLQSAGRSPQQIWRLLALAVTFQYFDLAFEIVSIIQSAGLLGDADVEQLDRDVERCAAFATQLFVEQVGSDGVPALMAASFRDRSQPN